MKTDDREERGNGGGRGVKIKLSVSDEKYDEIREYLEKKGIEIDDDAEFVLTQKDRYLGHISVKDSRGVKMRMTVEDVVTIESYGHTIEIHTSTETYTSSERLYQLENLLDPDKFLRVSNSVIVAADQIKEIIPAFHMKFTLKMKNGDRVDVTRNYYKKFKEWYGF